MLDLSDEVNLNVIFSWDNNRFVRQLVDQWHQPHRPAVRSLQSAIVCGYTLNKAGEVRRLFYVLSHPEIVDGLQLDPNELDDPHGGVPVLARNLACCKSPDCYTFLPEAVLEMEKKRRAGHVKFWQTNARLTAPKPEPVKKEGYWTRLLFR